MSTTISISNQSIFNRLDEMKHFVFNRREIQKKIQLENFVNRSFLNNDAANRKYLCYAYLISSDMIPSYDKENEVFYNRPQDIIDRYIESNLCLAIISDTGDCKICVRVKDPVYPIMPIKDYVRYFEFAMKRNKISPTRVITIPNIDLNKRYTSSVCICDRTLKYPIHMINTVGFIKDCSPIIDRENIESYISSIERYRNSIISDRKNFWI